MALATRHLSLLGAALGVALLAACASSPPTQFYTLDPIAPEARTMTATGPIIVVDHVSIPAVLDRPELVREHAAERLKVDDFSHWGAPLGDLLRATLVEDLTARLPAGRVATANAPRLEGAVNLTVDILAVHEEPNGLALDVGWVMTQATPAAGQARKLQLARHERIETPLGGSSQQAYAAALSRAIADLASRIAVSSNSE